MLGSRRRYPTEPSLPCSLLLNQVFVLWKKIQFPIVTWGQKKRGQWLCVRIQRGGRVGVTRVWARSFQLRSPELQSSFLFAERFGKLNSLPLPLPSPSLSFPLSFSLPPPVSLSLYPSFLLPPLLCLNKSICTYSQIKALERVFIVLNVSVGMPASLFK